jgi:hypothetical protein
LTCFSFFCVLRSVVVDELRRVFRLAGTAFSLFGYRLSVISQKSAVGGRQSAVSYRRSAIGYRRSDNYNDIHWVVITIYIGIRPILPSVCSRCFVEPINAKNFSRPRSCCTFRAYNSMIPIHVRKL